MKQVCSFLIVLMATLCLFVGTVQAGMLPAEITITADDYYEVWLNGIYIGNDADWIAPNSYPVTLYDNQPNLIAVYAADIYGVAWMLAGEVSFPGGLIVTSTAWKATDTPGAGNWWEPGYDDSSWGQAIALGTNEGFSAPWAIPGGLPGIDTSAQYIWTSDINSGTAYFRMAFNAEPVPEPSTILLLSFGLAGVGLLRRRFKNQQF
jgi:hypothetical protein